MLYYLNFRTVNGIFQFIYYKKGEDRSDQEAPIIYTHMYTYIIIYKEYTLYIHIISVAHWLGLEKE